MPVLTDAELAELELQQEDAQEKSNLDIADKTQQQIEKMERRLYEKMLGEVMAERVRAGYKWANNPVGFKRNGLKR